MAEADVTVVTGSCPDPLYVLGVPVTPFESYAQVCHAIADSINSGRKSFCVAINPEKVYQALQDDAFLHLLTSANFHLCDGIGISLAVSFLHGRRVRRITGVELFMSIIESAAANQWRVFLLGASTAVNEATSAVIRQRYPLVNVVGHQDGYFTDSDGVIEQINASRADILFVATGSPQQECWIARHRHKLDARFCMGVGGTFDVASGAKKRAPKLVRDTGTEWLYRLLKEPKRVVRQRVLPLFVIRVIAHKFHIVHAPHKTVGPPHVRQAERVVLDETPSDRSKSERP